MWDFRSKKESFVNLKKGAPKATRTTELDLPILRKGNAFRVIFFYPGEEGTYVENAEVTLFVNGIVHFKTANEESTTYLQNCEILWTSQQVSPDASVSKVRLLKTGGSRTEGMGVPAKETRRPVESKPGACENSPHDEP